MKVTLESTEHPADRLAVSLSRASGIVASVANCFNDHKADFAVTAAFVAHALKAVDSIILEASDALTDLNLEYDLAVKMAQEPEIPAKEVSGFFAEDNHEAVSDDYDSQSDRARTYDELLQKVTTAEIFASNSVTSDSAENELVPLLNSLKADLLRLRSVA